MAFDVLCVRRCSAWKNWNAPRKKPLIYICKNNNAQGGATARGASMDGGRTRARAFLGDFAAAGMAATCAIVIMHPVDVVKSRMQFQGEGGTPSMPAQPRGITSWLVDIGREEGVHALYRGLPAAIALQFSVTATRFATYGAAQALMGTSASGDPFLNFVLAGLSGAARAVVGVPWFAIKTRAQVYSTSPALTVGLSENPPVPLLRAFVDMGQSGMSGYFRGLGAFLPRVALFGAAQLSSYDWLKHRLSQLARAPPSVRHNGPTQHVIASVGAAAVSVFVIQPFDFLAARLQNQRVDAATGRGVLYSGVTDALVKSVRAEGPLVVYKGFRANVVRFCPYTVLVFVFMEQFKLLLK